MILYFKKNISLVFLYFFIIGTVFISMQCNSTSPAQSTGSGDVIKPVIAIKGNNPTIVELNSKYIEPGAVAIDNIDGDISVQVQVTSTVDTSRTGTYSVIYYVADKAGNVGTANRIVTVRSTDTIGPVITLKGSNPMTIDLMKPYKEPGATAVDIADGDISVKIKISGIVDTTKAATYLVTYSVIDKAGNSSTVCRTVFVQSEKVIEIVQPLTGDELSVLNDNILVVRYNPDSIVTPLCRHFSFDQKVWKSMTVRVVSRENVAPSDTTKYRYEVMVWKPTDDSLDVGDKIYIRVMGYNSSTKLHTVGPVTFY